MHSAMMQDTAGDALMSGMPGQSGPGQSGPGESGHAGGHGGGHGGMMPSLALVPLDAATHVAVASGDWSDRATWEGGVVPGDAARVVIPEGLTVTVDGVLAPEIKTVRADGVLAFATDRDTELKVDTLVTTMTGELRIGSREAPVDAGVTARVVFADDGVIDRDWDPSLISRGALLHGKTVINGAQKTGFTTLAEQPAAGATTLELSTIPVGWRVGDEITIAGTDANDPTGDEVATIAAIDGATVTLTSPLLRDHIAPRADLDVHVANLTRNVEFTSENEGALNRGHVMFMHTNDVEARHVAFEGLGRSDKGAGLDDWRLLSGNENSIGPDQTLVEDLGGTNVRGRYSVHFHRGGPEGDPGLVEGAVVRDDPGWAYVNHSSNVDFVGNVSHNIVGAAYNTEAGDEIGSFVGNIAIRTVNPGANLNPADAELDPGQAPDARVDAQDYGWQGDGFWFHGSGVTVDNNVVSGATGHAYIYWQLGLVERGLGENLVDVANLPNGELIGPDGTLVRTKHVPVPSFDGNDAYSAAKGLQIHYLHTDNRDDDEVELLADGLLTPVPQAYEETLQSTFSNSQFWNIRHSGVDAPYATRLTFDNFDLIGTGEEGSVGVKLDHFANQNNFTLTNISAEGFGVGIAAPRQGNAVIDGATLAAPVDLRINLPSSDPRNLEISDLVFAPITVPVVSDADLGRQNIAMMPELDFDVSGGLFDQPFEEDEDFGEDDEFEDDGDAVDDADEDGDEGDAEGLADAVLNVAFVGDSITDAPPEESFVSYLDGLLGEEIEAEPYAIGGSGITDAVAEPLPDTEVAEALLDSDAELVWIMIGGNDIEAGASAEDYEEALFYLVEMVQEMPTAPEIVIAAQPPFSAFDAEAHELFRDEWVPVMEFVAEETGAVFVDINAAVPDYPENYPDLIHPNAAGAETLAALIAHEVAELLPDEPALPGDIVRDEEEDVSEEDEEDPFDEDGEELFEEEFFDGYPSQLLPDRIVLDIPGFEGVGLYFDEQAPDFVPVPVGSEQARLLPEDAAGLTNAELQALYAISFGDALTPEGAMPAEFLTGGVVGPALPPFEMFPPELDPRFAFAGLEDEEFPDEDEEQFFEDDEDEVPDDDEDDAEDLPDDDGDELAEDDEGLDDQPDPGADAAAMLAKFYIVFYGRMPDADGFGFWLATMAGDPDAELGGVAAAFATAGEFLARFEGATADEIVTGMYANVLGRGPDAEGLAHWAQRLDAEDGLGLIDLALAFVFAPETDALHGGAIAEFLDGSGEEVEGDGDDAEDGEILVLEASNGPDSFVFPEDGIAIVEGFDPSEDVIEFGGRAEAHEEVDIFRDGDGVFLIFDGAEMFLETVDAEPDQIELVID